MLEIPGTPTSSSLFWKVKLTLRHYRRLARESALPSTLLAGTPQLLQSWSGVQTYFLTSEARLAAVYLRTHALAGQIFVHGNSIRKRFQSDAGSSIVEEP